ncbi:RICIN domain-containing protein [Micromonospora chalcea]|uniref:RICIN domain-containing protein n=1 Tax=Micromonospora sp. TSRI0369 TaxID=1703936 RepID=UPI000B17C731|nr:RICIN domain-containing protein [Micromonospora sp. TSRI0369]
MVVLAVLALAAAGCENASESSPSASDPATPTSVASASASAAASASASAPAVAVDTSTNEKPVDGSDAAAVKTVDVAGQPAAQAPPSAGGYYKLKTVFRGENECLEGNRVDGNSTLAGAAFQNTCQDVDGQAWSFTKRPDGYYTLRTKFLGEEKCLEGNQLAGKVLGGAAFLDTCREVTGQQWKLVKAGDNLFRLQTKFREKEGECLEGNRFAPTSVLKGAAFTDKCQNVTGQLWYLTAIPA